MSARAGFADVSHIFVKVAEADEPMSLDNLAWEHVAPCGCTCGIMIAETVDAEAAHRRITPNAEQRRRDEAAGFNLRLAPRDLVLDRLGNRCSCSPRFGLNKVAVPEGYRWAEATGNRRQHLVAVGTETPKEFRIWAKHVHAGPRDHENLWERPWLMDLPTCRTCERWAKGQAVTS